MKRINDRTVEFTNQAEVDAVERFDRALDRGLSIQEAATVALEDVPAIRRGWTFSREFVDYLSEGTLLVARKTGRIIAVPLQVSVIRESKGDA